MAKHAHEIQGGIKPTVYGVADNLWKTGRAHQILNSMYMQRNVCACIPSGNPQAQIWKSVPGSQPTNENIWASLQWTSESLKGRCCSTSVTYFGRATVIYM